MKKLIEQQKDKIKWTARKIVFAPIYIPVSIIMEHKVTNFIKAASGIKES